MNVKLSTIKYQRRRSLQLLLKLKLNVSAPDAELEVEKILIDEETDEINMEEIQNDVDSDIELMDDE